MWSYWHRTNLALHPAPVRAPRVFHADTEGKLRCINHQTSKSHRLFFVFVFVYRYMYRTYQTPLSVDIQHYCYEYRLIVDCCSFCSLNSDETYRIDANSTTVELPRSLHYPRPLSYPDHSVTPIVQMLRSLS